MIGGGGHRRVGQVQNLLVRELLVQPVEHRLKIEGAAGAGFWHRAGLLIIGADLLRREGPVVQRLVAHRDVHRHQIDAVFLRLLRRQVGTGFRYQDDFFIHCQLTPLSFIFGEGGDEPPSFQFETFVTFKSICLLIPHLCAFVKQNLGKHGFWGRKKRPPQRRRTLFGMAFDRLFNTPVLPPPG